MEFAHLVSAIAAGAMLAHVQALRGLIGLAALVITLLMQAPAVAHELRPGSFTMQPMAQDRYVVTWRAPEIQGARHAIAPTLPPGCTPRSGQGAHTWTARCPQVSAGDEIVFSGLQEAGATVFVRIRLRDGGAIDTLVTSQRPQVAIGGAPAPGLPAFLRLGLEHILGGVDHLLFVAGLCLLIADRWRLAAALTAFTLAHSLTLGAAALGVIGLASRPVETTIALSIAFVGAEAVRHARGARSLAASAPWMFAFGFGLLHGFGFAGALSDIGLPPDARIAALLLFNLGVELGQFLVVAVLLTAGMLTKTLSGRLASGRLAYARVAAGYAIGIAGAFWTIERLLG